MTVSENIHSLTYYYIKTLNMDLKNCKKLVQYSLASQMLPNSIHTKNWTEVEQILDYLEIPNNISLKERLAYYQLLEK